MNTQPRHVMAIESAVCGGSISLQKNGSEIANWIGLSDVSKAEDLLVNIAAILKENNVSRDMIDMIAVSAGPGSFTGIRIGIATALGLKSGLRIEMSTESALKAMAYEMANIKPVIAAVPTGRNWVCLQTFQNNAGDVAALDEPRTLADEDFFQFVSTERTTTFVLHESLYRKFASSTTITNFGANIAYAIGKICQQNPGAATSPLFISKSV